MEGMDLIEGQDSPIRQHNNRRAPRVEARVEVKLQFPDGEQRYFTRDISYMGVFIECPDPLPMRKLVRFSTTPDGGSEPLQMLGIVAHRVNAADAMDAGISTGMGIQLFPVGHDVRSAWRAFVRTEYDKDPSAREEVRRQEYPCVKVRFPSPNDLQIFAAQHVSSGDVFIRTADLYQQGTRVWLEAVHPQTGQSSRVEAIVLEFVEAPRANRGMRLMFPDAEGASEQLMAFAAQ